MKKVPLRRCVITNEQFPKKELIRVVRTVDNKVVVDLTGKLNGHGAYLKKDLDVFKKARDKRILDHILETKTEDSLYDELEKLI